VTLTVKNHDTTVMADSLFTSITEWRIATCTPYGFATQTRLQIASAPIEPIFIYHYGLATQLASIELVAWCKSNYLVKCLQSPQSTTTNSQHRLVSRIVIYHYSCGLTDTLRFRLSLLMRTCKSDQPNFHISLITQLSPSYLRPTGHASWIKW